MTDLSKIKQPIYMMGWPSAYGGANSERWHTLKLWRKMGLDVTVIPSGVRMPDHADWIPRLDAIGCEIAHPGTADLTGDGKIAVSFCDSGFRNAASQLRKTGWKTIYVPCMLAPYLEEKYGQPIADLYVFQSIYQRDQLLPALGLPEGCYRMIRGAFDASEFKHNPKPHKPGEPFVVGKLASGGYRLETNADGSHDAVARLDKWPADLWAQYARIPYAPLRARVMGWTAEVQEKCGPPPPWAEALPQGAETTQQFLESIHCLLPGLGCCAENWPRIALEARAVGVPIIAENKGGWKEILTGSGWANDALVTDAEQQAFRVAAIAHGYDAPIAYDFGSDSVQNEVGKAWLELFEELSA